jgi:hypothetical protein
MKGRCLAALACLALATTPMLAAGPQRITDSQTAAVDARGRLRGLSAEEIRQYAASFKPRPSVVRINTLGNGMGSIALDESYDHHMMVRLNLDGSVSFACNDDHAALIEFVSHAAPSDTILRIKPVAARAINAERE